MKAMWAGRFSKELSKELNDFNSSIPFDARMYRQDIEGSLAHAAMLAATGILSAAEGEAICSGLESILHDLDSGALRPDPSAEDIHMFVEAELTKRIGDAGKRLHTARSRNDQVALDLRLYLSSNLAGQTLRPVHAPADPAVAIDRLHRQYLTAGSDWQRDMRYILRANSLLLACLLPQAL